MGEWKAVAVLAVLVAGAVGAFAVYSFGWRDDSDVRSRVHILRDGDVVLRPEAATRCEASSEGGQRNLFCTRTDSGRHQVVFYRDDVLVWPLDRGPDGPPFVYSWEP